MRYVPSRRCCILGPQKTAGATRQAVSLAGVAMSPVSDDGSGSHASGRSWHEIEKIGTPGHSAVAKSGEAKTGRRVAHAVP
jgi:hypothetical protein